MKNIIILLLSITFLFISRPAHAQSNENQTGNPIMSFFSKVITLNNPVKLEDPKDGFKVGEQPKFEVKVPQKSEEAVGKSVEKKFETKQEKVEAYFVYEGSKEKIPAEIKKDAKGEFTVAMPISDEEIKRGNYTLNVTARESFIYERNLTQDFSWGVLAINTNKSIYLPNETANLAIGVLNETGSTICNAKLELTIADPDHNEKKLTTQNKDFILNEDCGNNYTPQPDYATKYKVGKAGRYFMNIKATTVNGTHSITDYFEVKDSVPFDIERVNYPTRIYPAAAYKTEIKIKANQDYKGKITDTVLKSFKVTNISNNGKIDQEGSFKRYYVSDETKENDEKVWSKIKNKSELLYSAPSKIDKSPTNITWDVDFKKGETYTLNYTLNFPPISPEFYLVGPMKIGNFSEIRQWQIASDATKCWKGTVDANWSTTNNWATTAGANTTLASSDVAVFDSTTTTCSGGATNNNSTVNAGFGGSIQAVRIINTYTGTITQSRSLTITTGGATVGFVQSTTGSTWNQGANDLTLNVAASNTSDFSISNGTFNGGSGNISVDDDFTISGGTFDDGSGTITVRDDFTLSGGTSTFDSGTVQIQSNGDYTATITGSKTFNNFTFYSNETFGTTCPPAISSTTIASGTTLTINGILNFSTANEHGCKWSTIDGPGTIIAKGDINTSNTFASGDPMVASTTLTVNGTGNQTITGDSSGYAAYLPATIIDKPSGTLTFSGHIYFLNDFTLLRGAINPSDSTITFTAVDDNVSVITGNITLNNIQFVQTTLGVGEPGCEFFTDSDISIASGSTLTALGSLDLLQGVTNGCGDLVVNGPGNLYVQGDYTTTLNNTDQISGDVAVTLIGAKDQTISNTAEMLPSGTITINKTGGTASLGYDLDLNPGQDLTIATGILNLSTYNLTSVDTLTINGQLNQLTGNIITASDGEIVVGSAGIWTNNSTGDITIGHTGSGVANAGYIRLDGGGTQCGDSDSISINTTNPGSAVNWSGAGTYIIIDTTYRDVNDSGITINTYSSTKTSNSDWVSNSGCPTYSNRNVINLEGGTTFNGGVNFNSN